MFYTATGEIKYSTPVEQIEHFTNNDLTSADYLIDLLNTEINAIIEPTNVLIRNLRSQKNRLVFAKEDSKTKSFTQDQERQYNELIQQEEQLLQKIEELKLSNFQRILDAQIKFPVLEEQEQIKVLEYLNINIKRILTKINERLIMQSMMQQPLIRRSMQQKLIEKQSMQQQKLMAEQSRQQQQKMQQKLIQQPKINAKKK